MSGIAEVGATGVELKEHQCSIKKITVSTKWKDPDLEVPKEVCATVYDNTIAEKGKTIFIISSPKGEEVTIKTEREERECKRESHKKYQMSWDDYKRSDEGTATTKDNNEKDVSYTKTVSKINVEGLALSVAKDAALSYPLPVLLPFNLIRTPLFIEREIKNEDPISIKCFEVGGMWDALKYLCLPIPLEKTYITKCTHLSCKEGPIHYQIISYPDISFKIEAAIGMKDKNKKSYYSGGELLDGFKNMDLKWCSPTLKIEVKYNGKANKILLDVDFNRIADIKSNWGERKKEKGQEEKGIEVDYANLKTKKTEIEEKQFISFKYIENDVVKEEFDSKIIEKFPLALKKIIALFKAVVMICNHDFTNKIITLFKTCMNQAAKIQPWYFNIIPPKVKFSAVGKYQTSEDLSRIGRVIKGSVSADPLIGGSVTLDLLAVILNLWSCGIASAVYLFLKNIKDIVEDLFGEEIQDIPGLYLDLVGSGMGKIPFFQILWDTSNEKEEVKTNFLTTGDGKFGEVLELKVDFKGGAKGRVDFLVVFTTAIDTSISATSSVSIIIGLHVKDDGLHVPIDVLFNGLKWKYHMKIKAGLSKTVKLLTKPFKKFLPIMSKMDWDLVDREGEQIKVGNFKLLPKLDKKIWYSEEFHLFNTKKSEEKI